ncbi:hypothetical protein YA0089_26820 [Pseudomonas viridiflava]|uniref:hypothetical protein n=1 Tax=Pseudomonas viridiflava TaxID=33069 RepID=UPI0018E60E03|nr:hypothetical protein [Pseudomonas viridiflava]MBI6727232.1 hypothetical protein [Pseudomonas viridiflava]
MNTTDYETLRLSLTAQLTGMALIDERYIPVIKALRFAEEHHVGMRRCGKIRSFYHQLSILGDAISEHKKLKFPFLVYISVLLHDTIEDYPELAERLREEIPEGYEYSLRMSKIRHGVKRDPQEVADEQANCIVCSVTKPLDRIHNQSTMIGVFELDKIEEQINETEKYILPLIKKAKMKFPEQNAIYESMKSDLNMQIMYCRMYVEQGRKAKANEEKIKLWSDT